MQRLGSTATNLLSHARSRYIYRDKELPAFVCGTIAFTYSFTDPYLPIYKRLSMAVCGVAVGWMTSYTIPLSIGAYTLYTKNSE